MINLIESTSFRITDKKVKPLSDKKMENLKSSCNENHYQMLKEREIRKVETPFFIQGGKIDKPFL